LTGFYIRFWSENGAQNKDLCEYPDLSSIDLIRQRLGFVKIGSRQGSESNVGAADRLYHLPRHLASQNAKLNFSILDKLSIYVYKLGNLDK